MNDAQTIFKLAGLLGAGVSLTRAQQLISAELAELSPAVGAQLSELLELAQNFGGSVAPLLEAMADRIESQNRLVSQIELAAASPKATARLVSLLPIICLGLAQLLQINVFAAITRNPAAMASVVVGCGLLAGNLRWVNRALARAENLVLTQVSSLQVFGALLLRLAAGVSVSQLRRHESPPEVDALYDLAQAHGIELLPLLQSQLRHLEMRSRFEIERNLASLSVKLLVPIGLLVLPALIFLAVIPAGIALFAAK